MTAPTITALPAYPVRGEARATFATKANDTVAALPTMVTEINVATAFVDSTAVTIDAQATEVDDNTTKVTAIAGTYTARNQGSHASAPTTRNDGSALQVGDLYYDSVAGKMKIYQ